MNVLRITNLLLSDAFTARYKENDPVQCKRGGCENEKKFRSDDIAGLCKNCAASLREERKSLRQMGLNRSDFGE